MANRRPTALIDSYIKIYDVGAAPYEQFPAAGVLELAAEICNFVKIFRKARNLANVF